MIVSKKKVMAKISKAIDSKKGILIKWNEIGNMIIVIGNVNDDDEVLNPKIFAELTLIDEDK